MLREHALWLANNGGRRAEFVGADLRLMDLSGLELSEVCFKRAQLSSARLVGSQLRGADFGGASLFQANLSGAFAQDANFELADLTYANLEGTDLVGATFKGARLSSTRLTGADVHEVDFTDAALSGAELSGTLMPDYVQIARNDIERILAMAPKEAPAVLAALEAGQVDGRVYVGACACLVGTIANARGIDAECLPSRAVAAPGDLCRDPHCPAEMWFRRIQEGDTPSNNPACALTALWVRDFIASRAAA